MTPPKGLYKVMVTNKYDNMADNKTQGKQKPNFKISIKTLIGEGFNSYDKALLFALELGYKEENNSVLIIEEGKKVAEWKD